MKKGVALNYIFCVIYLAFSVMGLTFMKLGANNTSLHSIEIPIVKMQLNWLAIIGYMCYACSFLIYTVVITKFDLGMIIPLLSGIVNVLVFIVAIIVFKESFTVYSVAGIILISAGVFLMNIK